MNEHRNEPHFPINDRLYYGIPDAAGKLGISEHTLRREIARRNIRHLRHARGIFLLPEWLDEWIDRKTTAPRNGRGR